MPLLGPPDMMLPAAQLRAMRRAAAEKKAQDEAAAIAAEKQALAQKLGAMPDRGLTGGEYHRLVGEAGPATQRAVSFLPISSGGEADQEAARAGVNEILARPTRSSGITGAYGPTVTGTDAGYAKAAALRRAEAAAAARTSAAQQSANAVGADERAAAEGMRTAPSDISEGQLATNREAAKSRAEMRARDEQNRMAIARDARAASAAAAEQAAYDNLLVRRDPKAAAELRWRANQEAGEEARSQRFNEMQQRRLESQERLASESDASAERRHGESVGVQREGLDVQREGYTSAERRAEIERKAAEKRFETESQRHAADRESRERQHSETVGVQKDANQQSAEDRKQARQERADERKQIHADKLSADQRETYFNLMKRYDFQLAKGTITDEDYDRASAAVARSLNQPAPPPSPLPPSPKTTMDAIPPAIQTMLSDRIGTTDSVLAKLREMPIEDIEALAPHIKAYMRSRRPNQSLDDELRLGFFDEFMDAPWAEDVHLEDRNQVRAIRNALGLPTDTIYSPTGHWGRFGIHRIGATARQMLGRE